MEKKQRGRPPVPCDLCGRRVGEVSVVRKHDHVVHDKVKDFECHICRRRFTEKSNLKNHKVALHEHEGAHRCHCCCKMYNCIDGLASVPQLSTQVVQGNIGEKTMWQCIKDVKVL